MKIEEKVKTETKKLALVVVFMSAFVLALFSLPHHI